MLLQPVVQQVVGLLHVTQSPGCCYPKEAPLVAISPLINYMPSTSLLRLTYYLQNFCIKQAENEFACVYDLITKLQDNNEEVSPAKLVLFLVTSYKLFSFNQ